MRFSTSLKRPGIKTRSPEQKTSPHYAVYAFQRPGMPRGDQSDWERILSCECPRQAYDQAQTLFKTNQYARVEIKKINQNEPAKKKPATMKVFGEAQRRPSIFWIIFAFAAGLFMAYQAPTMMHALM